MDLITIKNPNQKILKRKAPLFDFKKYTAPEIRKVISEMRKIMKLNDGVGLSANQIGLDWRMFIAEYNKKLYVIFNPKIIRVSEDQETLEEGCLSVPDVFIEVSRPKSIILEGNDRAGKKNKIKAFGVLARIFQHETDHLDGKLITDYLIR